MAETWQWSDAMIPTQLLEFKGSCRLGYSGRELARSVFEAKGAPCSR